MKYKIVYQGQVKDPSGYGVAARGYIQSLLAYFEKSKIDVDFKIVPIVADQMNSLTPEENAMIDKYSFKSDGDIEKWIEEKDYYYIIHHPPTYAQKIKSTHLFARNSLKNIFFTVWETDALPPVWNDIFMGLNIDKVVVPCDWNKQVFINSLEKYDNLLPVTTVPHLINDDFLNTKDEDVSSSVTRVFDSEKFNCLTVGQWTDRKSLISVVKAFFMEFHAHEDCNLIVKTYGNIQVSDPEFQNRQREQIAHEIVKYKRAICSDNLGQPNKSSVTLLYGLMSKTDMNFLYKNSDVFALLSKAEGFGLPIAESILHSTPVVVHNKGGHVDYVSPRENFIVETFEVPACCTYFPGVYSVESNWYDTDLRSARKQLREAYNVWKSSPDELNRRGKDSRTHMLKQTGSPYKLGKKLFNFVVG